MNFTQEFEGYLDRFRLRLAQLIMARGAAILALAAFAITVVAVALAVRRGFPASQAIVSRVLLFGSLAALAYWFVVRPKRRIEQNGAFDIEQRTPDFRGRIETFVEMDESGNPMRDLLAEDALKVAAGHPPEAQIKQSEFTLALSTAVVAISGLLFLAIAGPGNYAYGVRNLWIGWALPGVLPPQSITVSPGDDGIRLGGTVRVMATTEGFDPRQAQVHASFGDGEWQQVEMQNNEDGFEFTFFSVRQPLEYFVSAANVRSPTFQVSVVDLPEVVNLAMTYEYPDWTGREPEVHDPGGDVRAIADTEVEVRVRTDRAMTPGELIVDGRAIPLSIEGDTATATFVVENDGQYFVAAKVGGEQIRLTDDYFITVPDDELPQISFERPGRDWSASSIEEVTARVRAEDDFLLESLELRYSVNGGEWQTVDLSIEAGDEEDTAADSRAVAVDHTFFLETLSQDATQEALVPGDLISYYAVAEDRENSSRTDIFFIDVQPFDRRYSQSQQAGGGGGGQQGGQQSEISERQREIIVSTWNLIREQQEKRRDDEAYVSDNAALLSRLQTTLRGQVDTLRQRMQARQLTASDEDMARFAENLNKAAAAMLPAAERLGEIELEQAILPEQEALQHLLAAEAVFTDISVSLQANNGGGGGGQAGRDLTEMFELEMDLEKNQYETGSSAAPTPPQQQMQEAADELGELARRQEQLARNLRQSQVPTPAQRWQQEMLRRDVQELRERLEEMQQQAANSQSASQSQSQSQSQSESQSQGQPSGEPGSASGQSGASPDSSNEADRELDDLKRRLDSALRAMNEADDSMRNGASSEEGLQRAVEEAQRQLEGAEQQAEEGKRRAMQASLGDLTDRAEELHDTQAALEEALQQSIRGISVGQNELDRLDSGMTIDEEYEIAAEKRRLQSEIQTLEQDARDTAQRLDEDQPRIASELREAIDELREAAIEMRLARAAAYIEQGQAVFVISSESASTDALRELRDDMRRAESMTGDGRSNGDANDTREGDGAGGSVAEALDETQQLRRSLQQMTEGNARTGGFANRGRDDLQESTGIRVDDLDLTHDFSRRSDDLSQNVIGLTNELREIGTTMQDIDELRRLATEVSAADFSGNPELLEEESRLALSLVEQLELALAKAERQNSGSIRTTPTDEISDAHKEIIADYYRKLGQTGESAAGAN